ncbi:MAG TPA: glycosyltransferase family 39 protein [Candidatus Saccharimonadales bacterium]|nr:glycosyltransferase family 39 protein [Candidatus Saccharimonadales bacterium]
METETVSKGETSFWRSDLALLAGIALATIVVHWITGGKYGFHRDELATLEDARHLDWGFVAYPPVTPFFGRLSLILFGRSLAGFRFFAALAEAAAVVLTGLMARELGGRRGAVLVAAFAAIPFCLGAGALMQYVSFDCFFWVLTAYFVLRLLKSDDARWWLAIGASLGLGMETKWTMGVLALGIVAGVMLTDARRFLRTKWLWYGVGISVLVFLPNVIWQARHNFISLDFLSYIHARDIRIGRTKGFLPDQLKMTLLAVPIWVAGLHFYVVSPAGKRFRMLGWMYIVPLLLFIIAQGRGYYLAAAYPMLYAAGSVWGEGKLATIWPGWANVVRGVVWVALLADIALVGAITLPMAPVNSGLWRFASKINGDLREELGWQELAETVAQIRDRLPAEDRTELGILAGNYGEAGALNLYGPDHGLPTAISGTNSFWLRGYGATAPQTVIVTGFSQHWVEEHFASCELAGHTSNRYGVPNEETENHPDIFVCRGLKQSWPEFWKGFRRFG